MNATLKSIALDGDEPVLHLVLASEVADVTKVQFDMKVHLPAGSIADRSVADIDRLVLDCLRKALSAYAQNKPFQWQ